MSPSLKIITCFSASQGVGEEKEIWGKLSDHQGQQVKADIKVENKWINTVKTGKRDARRSMWDNA